MNAQHRTASYWCYNCTRFVHLLSQAAIACPHCQSGFVEEIRAGADASPRHRLSPFPDDHLSLRRQGLRRRRRDAAGNRSPFNPVIVLRGPGDDSAAEHDGSSTFELFYDDGTALASARSRPPCPSSSSAQASTAYSSSSRRSR